MSSSRCLNLLRYFCWKMNRHLFEFFRVFEATFIPHGFSQPRLQIHLAFAFFFRSLFLDFSIFHNIKNSKNSEKGLGLRFSLTTHAIIHQCYSNQQLFEISFIQRDFCPLDEKLVSYSSFSKNSVTLLKNAEN